MTIRPRSNKPRLACGIAAAALAIGIGVSVVSSQPPTILQDTPTPVSTPESRTLRSYLNKSLIRLPIELNDSLRGLVQEIQLYVKEKPGDPWILREKVDGGRDAFMFQAPRDGEYAFMMVTIDRQGKGMPANLQNEPAGLIVVIDTQRPQVELTNLGSTQEGQLIQCDIKDANLDSAKLRFTFQGGDRVFRSMVPVSGRPNVYCIPSECVCTGLVRILASDLAGNNSEFEQHLNQMSTSATRSKFVQTNEAPRVLPDNLQSAPGIAPPEPHGVGKPAVGVPNAAVKPQKQNDVGAVRPDGSEGPRWQEPEIHQTEHRVPADRRFVNSTKVSLDYQIENASAAAKIEVWMTKDHAKTWHKLNEEAATKTSIDVNLPGEGIVGLTLVARSGAAAGTAPGAGTTPDGWVEVDMTPPQAEITKAEPIQAGGKHSIAIHWNVKDKNLGDTPVELFFAATSQGPWLPIAKGLKSKGAYVWTPPSEIGAQAYVRLAARDQAGNQGTAETREPIATGNAPPRALLRNITSGSPDPVLPMPRN